ncbi:DUF6285 domain-containing protein [Methylobacterium sp. J-076]|uniref:DUF6285 domain-containing protein n=1 Tax=Methylobacterium sp. J-076 TaxID=2836655 RepID=UPI001FB96997|nr:DUF6285 domain-containing protein [Methylobacterium sp. J-076]MCJ2014772.1 DUF6285 domain-containing protein [Methylobacterium sp. J-076]
MRDDPSGAALIDAARRALTEEVVPGLAGRPRYVALMVANALGIALREIAQADAVAHAWDRALPPGPEPEDAKRATLVAAIRAGGHDGDAALHAALLETATVASGIWKAPKAADA